MAKRSWGELVEIYSDFWLGVASAGAQGVADMAKTVQKRSQERREGLFDLETVAASVKVVTHHVATSLSAVAAAAKDVEERVKTRSHGGHHHSEGHFHTKHESADSSDE